MAQVAVGDSVVTVATGPFRGMVSNAGSNSVFLGRGEDVTTSNGYELAAGKAIPLDIPAGGSRMTAIAAASGERVDTISCV